MAPKKPADFFVFEMANNHQGSFEHGLTIIEEMDKITRKHGISAAVKFQYRDLDSFIHPAFAGRTDAKHVGRFLSTKLSRTEYLQMVSAVKQSAMATMCTPFDEASVGVILEHEIDIIKVASCSAMDWPLLRAIARAGKPVICSTGGLSISDIDKVVNFFLHRDVELSLLHCVSVYPTPLEALNLSFVERFRHRYPTVRIGYSGHESPDDTEVVQIALAKGATIFERHVGVPTSEIKLNNYSMNPAQTDAWVAAALRARQACGTDEEKPINEEEAASLRSLARGVYASRPIQAGDRLSRADVFFAMPCVQGQATAGDFRENIVASRDYALNDAIWDKRQLGIIAELRSLLHEVKGMFNEAGIAVGDNFDVEISHHYGIEEVRQTGAVILNIVNREYCKKLIAIIPGQRHPSHKHMKKEETFHLLWGEMTVELNGEVTVLRPGDHLLVPRDAWHAFSTTGGAIFEEISTTHVRGDSLYADETIEGTDPMARKTVIESW